MNGSKHKEERVSVECSATNGASMSQPLTPRLRTIRDVGEDLGAAIFWAFQAAALMNSQQLWPPAHDEACRLSSTGQEAVSLAEDPLTAERENQFSLSMWPQAGQPLSNGLLHGKHKLYLDSVRLQEGGQA